MPKVASFGCACERFGPEARGGDYLGVRRSERVAWRRCPTRGCLIGDWALPELRRDKPVLDRGCGGTMDRLW